MTSPPLSPDDVTFLVTIITHERRPYLSHEPHALAAMDHLSRFPQRLALDLLGFVILPDRAFLLLCAPSLAWIAQGIHHYKRSVADAIELEPLWQDGFHLRYTDNSAAVCARIEHEPVLQRLVERAEDFPWSSACAQRTTSTHKEQPDLRQEILIAR